MSEPMLPGVPGGGWTEVVDADEARKSRLILEAQLARERQEDETAAAKFAEAAVIEERLGERSIERNLRDQSFVHFYSAASCWAQAGNFYEAIALCDRLLSEPDLPVPLRRRVEGYAATIRARRAQWYGEIVRQAAESV